MEELYRSVIPDSTIHCIDWSTVNLIAVSVSVVKKDFVGEGFDRSKVHQLLVFDANRPWQYHCVYGDNKTITTEVKWSLDGSCLLSVEQDGIARVWRMKERCMNSWQRTHRIQLHNKKLLHTSWVEYQPLPNVNCNKEVWPELLEYYPYSSYLHSVIPEAAVFVYVDGLVQLVSFSKVEPTLCEVQLDVDGCLCASRTQTASDGTLLCVVVSNDDLVKLFVLRVSMNPGFNLSLSSSLATSFHPTGGGGGQLTDLVMHPDTGGCLLHICYDNTNLLQWSLRNTAQSDTYIAKRESLHITHQPVTFIDCTSLCLKGCGPFSASLVTTPATGSEFMLDVSGENREKCCPVELIVMVHSDNTATVLNRSSYQLLYNGKLKHDTCVEPAAKRPRLDADRSSTMCLCLSPNGCCVAFNSNDSVFVYALAPFVLGEKGFESPDVSRWSVLLTMAAVRNLSVWDIAVMCSRVSYQQKDSSLLMKILERWTESYIQNSDTWKDMLLSSYLQTCYILHCCHDQGLVLSLDQRDLLRLHATFSIFTLALPTSSKLETPLSQTIKESNDSPEDNLDAIVRSFQLKDFEIPKELAGQLQGHAQWIIEFAIKVASRIANLTVERYPHRMSLMLVRHCLMLIYIWNKALSTPLLAISDAAISLLYKVITSSINDELNCLEDTVKADVSRNFPSEERSLTLTLTKAANLQGFLHGLSKTSELPETYRRDQPPPIRPHIQSHYSAYDPYSPLGLVVPQGLIPPWRDVFVEGQVDIIHGGYLTDSVVQDAKLRQCSSCRCWTVASVDMSTDEKLLYCNPIHQWRHNWYKQCLCGSYWLNSKQ